MQRDHITSSIQLFSRIHWLDAIGYHHFFRTIRIISIDFHTNAFSDTGHVTSYIAISMYT